MPKMSDTLRDKSRSHSAKVKTASRRVQRRLKIARRIYCAKAFPSLYAL